MSRGLGRETIRCLRAIGPLLPSDEWPRSWGDNFRSRTAVRWFRGDTKGNEAVDEPGGVPEADPRADDFACGSKGTQLARRTEQGRSRIGAGCHGGARFACS